MLRYLEDLVFQAEQRTDRPLMVHVGRWIQDVLLEELDEVPINVGAASLNEFAHTIPDADEIVVETRPYKAGTGHAGGCWTDELWRVRISPMGVTRAELETYETLRLEMRAQEALDAARALERA